MAFRTILGATGVDHGATDLLSAAATARDIGAGQIVMGACSHSHLSERIFGDTTLWMTENAEIPVLGAH
ncbi:MAG: universal stress protein [Rhizobiaceae bacterium]|nr:universal stress protein [Rhizobiaceae bacterium]